MDHLTDAILIAGTISDWGWGSIILCDFDPKWVFQLQNIGDVFNISGGGGLAIHGVNYHSHSYLLIVYTKIRKMNGHY